VVYLLWEVAVMGTTEDAFKTCHCFTCKRDFHPMGIARHRAMHRDKREDCTIMFTAGDTYIWRYSTKKQSKNNDTLATTDEASH
jgi:hypothetical protein